MIKVKALIKLNEFNRKTPIKSGYTPDFDFIEKTLTGGCIILPNQDLLFPSDSAEVEIRFLNKEYLGDNFGSGTKFIFYEGRVPTGQGKIISVLQWE